MQYYALIAGLPDITLDDVKPAYTVQSFKKELNVILSKSDKKLINSLLLKYDNDNLLLLLKNKEAELNEKGTIAPDELADTIQKIKEEEKITNKNIPAYFKIFVSDYFAGADALRNLFWEDYLASLYYDCLSKSSNEFLQKWAEFNLNTCNILIALACRKNEREHAQYIIGDNETANTLRTSNARDFGVSELFEHFEEVKRIDDEPNLIEKERKIDLLRWRWIDDANFFNYFTIEQILGFMLKLQMLERWLSLDEEKGKQIFTEIVENLKAVKIE